MKRPKAGNPLRAIAYMRVSKDDLRLDQQRDAIERFALAQELTIVAWFHESGVSGAADLARRPALLEALGSLRSHDAGLLVACKRDRLARDVGHAAAIERLAQDEGARIVTADGVDASQTPEGQMIRGLLDLFAQYERQVISARTSAALQAKKARGEALGSNPPFGWTKVGHNLVLNPAEQLALQRIRELRSNRVSLAKIARTLTNEGHVSRGKEWHITTIVRALCA